MRVNATLTSIGRAVRRLRLASTQASVVKPPEEGCVRLDGYRPTFSPGTDKQRSRDLVDSRLRDVIRDVVNARRPWPLYLYGEVGSGKTCAALAMVDQFGGWYIKLADMCDLLIAANKGHLAWSSGHQWTVVDVWEIWGGAHLCVLDEVAARGAPSDFYRDTFQRCLDSRENKPLVVVGNCDLDTLSRVIDDRCASRLAFGTLVGLKGDRRMARD